MGYIRVFKYSLTGYVIGGTFGFLIDRLTTNSYNRYFYRGFRPWDYSSNDFFLFR